MRYCNACSSAEGTIHITVTVDVFAPKTNKQKIAQFWVCEACNKLLSDFLARDNNQRQRVAKAMCPPKTFTNNASGGDAQHT